ncbi:ABC transporter permease [Dyadobacter sp. LJ53]|uniref:ABC transporter permease n=1 Tax=Dyadobacter chenwenxiniae TaxID=2906456 RepID=UPI001F179F47|nr:ABC transporter permease [Dyadobacter chenwenxiniae]MCF0049233.1 ABC transporter permease [Dyadobacter chenwenxiniae]
MKNEKHISPPRWADKLFKILCPPELFEELQGDLHEQFELDVKRVGVKAAKSIYALETLKFAKPYFLKKRILTPKKADRRPLTADRPKMPIADSRQQTAKLAMLQNYLTTARRTLARHKSYTLINVLGLVLGMSCGILIFSLVNYHLGFDRFHEKSDRIYRVTSELRNETVSKYGTVPQPIAAAMRNDFSFVDKASMLINFGATISIPAVRNNPKFSDGIAYTEPSFFEIMDFPLVAGDKKTILSQPNTAVITEQLAEKYFHGQEAIGKSFRIDNKTDFTVTGVIKNLPENTDIRQEIFLSYVTISEPWLNGWRSIYSGSQAFVLLKPGTDCGKAQEAMAGISTKYYNAKDAKEFRFFLQPLPDMHLNEELGGAIAQSQLVALSLVAIFLIITACVNFINLATAQALGRSKEIGVRKVMGSMKSQLFWQFIIETALITVIAFVFAIALAYIALPYMNEMLSTRVTLDLLQDFNQPLFIICLLVIVTFISGSYPGLVLAGFQPITALKGKLTQNQIGGFSIRKGLVITQFAISQTLLIGTIVVASQMRFNNEADMGFKKDAIVMLPVPETSPAKTSAMRARLSQLPEVEKIAFCEAPPASPDGNFNTGIRYASRAEDEKFTIYLKSGDPEYLSMFGLQLVAGRNLAQSDTVREYLLNETAVKKLGVKPEEAIGKNVNINNADGIIVGVMKDFHNFSFRSKIEPVCLTTRSEHYGRVALKISGQNVPKTLASLEKIWNETNAEYIYSYQFLDDHLTYFYGNDELMLKLMWIFAAIAIFIGCLGLYGLISFMAAQKTKEIGVRKTLGAGVGSIVWLFGKQFAQLLVIAAPIGWWLMNKYLADFQYHIDLNATIFLAAIGITFLIAIVTVGYRSMKAALMNPVKALRSE